MNCNFLTQKYIFGIQERKKETVLCICKPWTKPPKRYSLKSSVKGLKMKTRVSI